MLTKSALFIATCLTCVACYSVGESYFKDLASKSGNICSDGGCTCNEGETCCKDNSEYYCCPGANATCCGNGNCCSSNQTTCSTCGGVAGVYECCAAEETVCCDKECCKPGHCVFGYCIFGKKSKPSFLKTRQLKPEGPSEKCIEITTPNPEQTTSTASTATTSTLGRTTVSTAMPPKTTATAAQRSTTTAGEQHKDCAGWRKAGSKTNGIYTIITTSGPLQVYCDMMTEGGGWIVIQRRKDGTVDFTRNWADYSSGFGNLNGEFWLGNSHISDISLADVQTMRIELTNCQYNTYYEVYAHFSLTNEQSNFTLNLSGSPMGTAGDSLTSSCPGQYCQNGMAFTTFDRDNDNFPIGNCAVYQTG
uniref:Fibrinogen C-terminal domain-containing protein n=1 Tax=Plectus sambesii TaxID=2011161 RepID=A0A914UZ53_9BILA